MASSEDFTSDRRVVELNDWVQIKQDLEENGFAIVHGVLTGEECDKYISQYREWLSQFVGPDEAPFHRHSLIQRYKIGHFEPSWTVRLKSKPVFAQLWETKKLLSSFDAVAIGKPPELENEQFARPEEKWLHIDQGDSRRGLHAYQGAVYLEETTDTDWVFRVLKGSHKHHDLFMDSNPLAAKRSGGDFCKLKDIEIGWFKSKGCDLTRVPVPKGGMVLWDSRTVHDSKRPELGRPHSDRWRFVVFVSMTPAIWANNKDLHERRTAYKKMFLTTHWSSQGADFFPDIEYHFPWKNITTIEKLPDIAGTDEAKLLAGIKEYDFEDGQPNGDTMFPVWTRGDYSTQPAVNGKKEKRNEKKRRK